MSTDSVVRSIVTKVKETSGDNLQWIGLGSSGLRTGEAQRTRGGEGDLRKLRIPEDTEGAERQLTGECTSL